MLYSLSNDITARAAFGKKCKDQEAFIQVALKIIELGAGFYLPDVFPSIKFVEMLSVMWSELEKYFRQGDKILDNIIHEHRASKATGKMTDVAGEEEEDLVHVLLNIMDQGNLEVPLTAENVKAVILFTIRPDRHSSSRPHPHPHAVTPNHPYLVVDQPSPSIIHLCRSSSSSPNRSRHSPDSSSSQYTTPAGPRLVDDQPFRPVVADQPSSAVASIFSISHRKMNDDDVLPTNIVDSSSSKGDEAVGSGSLEVAPLKRNVKPLALGGKGRQTSDSWNHFTKYQDDGRMRARCKYCPKNYACDSNTNGTTNMNKHLQKCKNYRAKLASADPKQKCLVKQAPITSYTTSSREGCGSSIGLGIFNKEDTRKALVEMLIVDELPFRFVEKRGFRKFCRVGMPRGETIGKCIEQVLLDWGIDRIFTITVDNASANQTAIFYVQRKLKSWNVDGLILDGKYLHLRCCAHIVNLIVNDGLKEMHDSVVAIRNAVKFVKSSPSRFQNFKKYVEREKIQDKGLVVLDVPTRWNSTYLMLASSLKFVKAFDRMDDEDGHYQSYFKAVENEPKKIGPPNFEHWENAKVFVQFLKTFYDVTLQFSATLSVTSNLYFHKWGTINNQLTTMSSDRNHLVCQMASAMKFKFEKYWGSLETTNKLLIIAVVLDPMYKLQYVSYCFAVLYGAGSRDSMTANIKDALVELYDSYNALYGGSGGSTSGGGSVDEIPLACGGEIDDSSIFDLSVAFSQTVEKQDSIRGTNEVERWRTVSSQAAALHAVACGSVVITMLDKPTVHAVEV
ncbi:hypothetical protein LWI29_023697 [Acer saccharum]|uniref:BED-type domain-containing protein n=1 Tax=Acer saccharum TaxID=4024 RepID=A0AA39VD79_ACESA|nr:hypothetical protein LWI29_023697 [Acer saccharum]